LEENKTEEKKPHQHKLQKIIITAKYTDLCKSIFKNLRKIQPRQRAFNTI